MIKYLFLLIVGLFVFNDVFAQKDTAVYYLQNSGKVVSTKDSADFFLVILPPDTNVDKKLFVAKEYYKNGKIKLVSGSKSNSLNNFYFQGPFTAFNADGQKTLTMNYDDGEPVGDKMEYYPNGKLYNIRSYIKGKKVFLKQFNDSTGNVIAENGKGQWKEYNENFSAINAEGEIDNGVEDGTWRGMLNDSVGFVSVFQKGKLISSSKINKSKSTTNSYTGVEQVPEFPGGLDAFGRFLNKNVNYPRQARKNGTQGRVIVSFVIERDGSVTNIKVARGIGDGCDEEALRVINLSPKWKPGIQDGHPVRVAYSVPVSFTLTN